MKPLRNSLETHLDLDLHQIPHTGKHQSSEHVCERGPPPPYLVHRPLPSTKFTGNLLFFIVPLTNQPTHKHTGWKQNLLDRSNDNLWLWHVSDQEVSAQREEEEESCSWGRAVVLLCFVSGRPEGSSLHQLWTLVLQTVHHLILGPVWFFRRLLLSPMWTKIQNRSWSSDSRSEQHCTCVCWCLHFWHQHMWFYFVPSYSINI